MYRTQFGECIDGAKATFGYIEMDPSSRYGRFREVLGKGAMKTVYRAFDEVLGMEVAWNQVKLNDVFRSPDELQRLYSEVHLLKNLDHDSIINFYTSWIDVDRRTFNFITEMFTSGTLREYTQKYKRVNIRAVKNWARQVLRGLAYLHGHDPPVIHRDLKCDNIFVNGHLGQVKIGDLGLAAILRGTKHAHSVIGTPEFMAPELYEEEYDELVDIYSFGMCVLEMLTTEYPYSECSNPAQIYKKVTSGKLPEAFYRIQDPEAQKFVGKCLENASKRLPARELLLDPFLASDEGELLPSPRIPNQKSTPTGTEMTPSFRANPTRSTNMTITGTMNSDDDEDAIFLKVKIIGKDGHARNIYFPFDIANDTPIDVVTEMVKELEITDWEPLEIADMIEEEVSALVPTGKEWCSSPKTYNQQHSFNYEEDDDIDGVHHPFQSLSSGSSSQASLHGLSTSYDQSPFYQGHNVPPTNDWLQENLLIDDDTSSQSSSNSYDYSNVNYCTGHENDLATSPRNKEPFFLAKYHKYSRFCPGEGTSANGYKQNCNDEVSTLRCYSSKEHKKVTKIRSLVDVRSQLLHRSLIDELNKRRMFKTVGAVENIGYKEPSHNFPMRGSVGEVFDGFCKFRS